VAAGLPSPSEVRASLGIPEAATILGTVGRLAEVKRQDLLIRAVSKLQATIPDLHLLLVGDGPERQKLVDLTRQLGLIPRIHFLGYQPFPEQYLSIIDV